MLPGLPHFVTTYIDSNSVGVLTPENQLGPDKVGGNSYRVIFTTIDINEHSTPPKWPP